jgi:hypothetical protein
MYACMYARGACEPLTSVVNLRVLGQTTNTAGEVSFHGVLELKGGGSCIRIGIRLTDDIATVGPLGGDRRAGGHTARESSRDAQCGNGLGVPSVRVHELSLVKGRLRMSTQKSFHDGLIGRDGSLVGL